MSFTYLQEQEGECLEVNCLDIPQSVLSKLESTKDKSYCSDNETKSCQSFQFGTTSALLTADHGADQLTFWPEDFHAKTSVQQVKEQELPERVRDFGKSMRELLTKYGLALSLPKTHHCFVLGDLELSSKIWPRWGMMQDGVCWELGMSVRHINATECGYLLPTPDASKRGPCKEYNPKSKSQSGRTLQTLAACDPLGVTWPTPTTQDAKNNGSPSQMRRNTKPLNAAVIGTQTQQNWGTPRCFMHKDALTDRGKGNLGEQVNEAHKMKKMGQLNPSWVEWLMGWPIGWTDLKPLETDKFRNVQQWHSVFYQKD